MSSTRKPSASAKRRPTPHLSGLAQHSLVEHSLCLLDTKRSLEPGMMHNVRYEYTDRHHNRKQATANIACPFGLSPNDELYLYGLLALTFAQPEPSPDFYATPHWCLRQLGIITPQSADGKRYRIFRAAVRRLAGVVYENDRFYDPVRGEHRAVAFGLLKYSLPIDEQSSRAWHFVWDQQFFRNCEAMRGSFAFDFEAYRSLDFASRRLFLLLSKVFWRNDHSPSFDIRKLGIETLGFSPTLATKEIKQKLIRTARTLLQAEIIALPLGVDDVKDLFEKRAKGEHLVRFQRGIYFDSPQQRVKFTATESPLVQPLEAIGFDALTIRRIIHQYKPRLIQEWSDITLAARELGRIKKSPQAYFSHYIAEAAEKKTTPPDWWHEYRKQEFAREQEQPSKPANKGGEEAAFEEYLQGEAHETFERVMGRLFEGLKESGRPEHEARQAAEQTARMNLRHRFRQEHPHATQDGPSSIGDIFRSMI